MLDLLELVWDWFGIKVGCDIGWEKVMEGRRMEGSKVRKGLLSSSAGFGCVRFCQCQVE